MSVFLLASREKRLGVYLDFLRPKYLSIKVVFLFVCFVVVTSHLMVRPALLHIKLKQ
jgi:hypothetical protein